MPTYRIYHRLNNGQKAIIDLNCASRSDVHKKLSSLDIKAIRIDEIPSRVGIKLPSAKVLMRIAIGVLVLGGGIKSLLSSLEEPQSISKNSETAIIQIEKPKLSRKHEQKDQQSLASSNKSTKGTFATIISTSIITNSSGAVIEDYVLSDGSRKRKIIPPPPVWDNAADQLIAMTLSIEPGIEAPPLPSGVSDQEFLKALRKPITIYNSDSPDLRNLKCRVREARNEIIEVMASTGKTFEEVINEHRSAMNNGTDLWLDAQNAFASFRENAPDDEIADYIEKVNQLLEDYGARKLITKKRKRGRNN